MFVVRKYNENFEKILTTQLKSRLKAYNVIQRSRPMHIFHNIILKRNQKCTKFTPTKIQVITWYTKKV